MNPIFLMMSVGSFVFAMCSPLWWLNVIAMYCCYQYFMMALEE